GGTWQRRRGKGRDNGDRRGSGGRGNVFLFQAEIGIRDWSVTGVQTCALPICVRTMVEEYKDEPYILMWVLGNENVYGVGNNSQKEPVAFYELVDRAAQLIHQLDPTRPVAIANGDVLFLDILKEKAPHIDVFGANVYRGEQGFGRSIFQDV